MKSVLSTLILSLLFLMTSLALAAQDTAGVKAETTALYQKAREQVSKLAGTPAARYAPEVVKKAEASLESAQNGLKLGNDRTTRQASELAVSQVKFAQVLADERIAAEKTATALKELTELEQRLATILAGKGEKP
jgi:hypothetical protein